MSGTPPILAGPTVELRVFDSSQIHERYLHWLADPQVNRFSQRLGTSGASASEAKRYLDGLAEDEVVLGIHHRGHGHVGNIKYGPVDWRNLRADISIMIGEASVWGQGVGKEAVYLVSEYLFDTLGLNRIDAGSHNPAFLRLAEDLGWKVEGVLKDRIRTSDGFLDHTLVALLANEFQAEDRYEGNLRTAGR